MKVFSVITRLLLVLLLTGCQESRSLSPLGTLPYLRDLHHMQEWLSGVQRDIQLWAHTSRQDLRQWSEEVFLDSAKAGSLFLAKSLLKLDVSPHVRDKEQRTALMYAALNGHTDLVRFLVNLGVGINIYDSHGWSPLMLAAWDGHRPVAQLLLDYGAKASAVSPSGMTALMAATTKGHTALVSLLLEHGAESTDPSGPQLLLRAASRGYSDIVQLLLTHGARPAAQDLYGWTALTEAVWNNQPTAASLFLTDLIVAPGVLEKNIVADFQRRETKKAIVELLQEKTE